MLAVPDSVALLNIGEFYEATNLKDGTKYLKYLGNGAFERRDEMHMLLDKYGGRNPVQR
jgi:hypothetical protein